jgi:hypothetical protein
MNLETRLRGALRPVDPPVGFAARVRARVEREADRRGSGAAGGGPSASSWRSWLATAAAALLIAGATYGYREYEQRRDAQAARSQVLLALEITSRALETVQRQVVVRTTETRTETETERAPAPAGGGQ